MYRNGERKKEQAICSYVSDMSVKCRIIDKNQAKELIKETFESLFDKVRFTNFIKIFQQIGTTGKGTKYVLRRHKDAKGATKTP